MRNATHTRRRVYDFIGICLNRADNYSNYIYAQKSIVTTGLKLCLEGAKALSALLLGKTDEAVASASTVVQQMRYYDASFLSSLLIFAHAYAVQVLIFAKQVEASKIGMETMKNFATTFPVGFRIFQRLNDQAMMEDYHQYTPSQTQFHSSGQIPQPSPEGGLSYGSGSQHLLFNQPGHLGFSNPGHLGTQIMATPENAFFNPNKNPQFQNKTQFSSLLFHSYQNPAPIFQQQQQPFHDEMSANILNQFPPSGNNSEH